MCDACLLSQVSSCEPGVVGLMQVRLGKKSRVAAES
jgi:hypothetical protein